MQKITSLLYRNRLKIVRIGLFQIISAFLMVTMTYAHPINAQEVLNKELTLQIDNASLKDVLRQIHQTTQVKFVYSDSHLNLQEKVSLRANKEKLHVILNRLLSPLKIEYRTVNEKILLSLAKKIEVESPPQPPKKVTTNMLGVDVKGKVTDEKGDPIPAVNVLVKGTSIGTSTNASGNYTLSNLPSNDDNLVLVFSFVGYETQEIALNNRSIINVQLKTDSKILNEVVVVGYGTAKKQDLSAAVSTVPDMAQIKNRPVLNVEGMIQGKVAGVTTVSNGGHPDKAPSITIRGTGSRGTESVLYVVDGVPNAPYNPADVETITVLKDAASASIYGAFSGAAGVILITTRQATQGKPSVEYSSFMGAKNAWKTPQSLNATDEARVANLAYTNAGLKPLDGWDATKNPYAQVTRTDWVDNIFRTGIIQRHNISVNAGSDKLSTLFQARYEKDEGTLLNTYNQNISLRFNTVYKFSDKVKFRQELFWNNNDARGTSTESGYTGTILSAIYMPRSATPYYEDGTFGGVGPRTSAYLGIHGDVVNPVATLLRNQPYNKSNDLQSVSEFSIANVIPGLSFISRFSYRQKSSLYKNFEPKRTEPGKPNDQNTLSYSTARDYHWIWENTANYNLNVDKHSIGAMVSMTAQENASRGFSAAAKGLQNEQDWAQFFINATIFDQTRPTDYDWKDRNLSYVGRLSYSWADRYFLTSSYRYDIAGRLATAARGKGFSGVTAAWKLTSEPFFHVKNIDLLKIRASWGRIGNIGSVAMYYGYPKLSSDNTYQIGNGAPTYNAFYVKSLNNPNLSWETSEQIDIGLDLAILKQKLNITVDYFDKLTFDLIKQQDTGWPNTNGLEAPYINQGKIRNTGFEFSASWRDQIGKLTYEINGNIATLKNRVEYIDDNPASFWQHTDAWRGTLTPFRSTVGQPYYSYWLIQTAGIFQTDQEAEAYTYNGTRIQPYAKAGDLKFVDANGDGKINDADRVYMGNAFPKLTYGFTTNLYWKNFDMSIFFQGVQGVKLFHAFKESTLNASEQGYNRWDKILDAWSPTNTGSSIPRISAADPNKNFQTPSDWYLESGDYLRLKNLMIGYTFPKFVGNTALRVYFSGDNLLTFTKYSGMDPEIGGFGLDGGQFPVSRIYSFGLKLKF
ncbi:SusC/RagA family TonB-linked outer membrane protein [Flectobacillus major]|uniref:SusC/RagA family TonB-linked outer membrane protein n=1 Tax=Flectobacillus major TaxID=103 RepID=UPI000423BF17|nr:TonB-dependent receptor [Flectobacillus major]